MTDGKHKYRRFQIRLSTAIVLMLVAALALGIFMHYRQVPGDEWREDIRIAMSEDVSVDIVDASTREAVEDLLSFVKHARLNVIKSPKLDTENKLTLKLKNVSLKDALNQLCNLSATNWESCNGALFVYPKANDSPSFRKAWVDEAWEPETVSKLSKKVTFCFVDTPFSEQIGFFRTLSQINIEIDPKCNQDKGIDAAWKVVDMRLGDAIFWCCYFADMEFSQKRDSVRGDVILIKPSSGTQVGGKR